MLSFVLPSFKTVAVIISIVVIALSIDKASSLLNRIIEGTPSIEGKMSRTIPLFRKVPQAKLGVSGKYHSLNHSSNSYSIVYRAKSILVWKSRQ